MSESSLTKTELAPAHAGSPGPKVIFAPEAILKEIKVPVPASSPSAPPAPNLLIVPTKPKPQNSRYISASIRRELWKRDGGECTRCHSTDALEIDHREPFALGGETRLENLRILCRSCNQFQAVIAFGVEKVGRYRRPATDRN